MDIFQFSLGIGVALLMGVAIGLERQYRQHPAGLRTTSLVCVGAALFVSLSRLMNDTSSPTRMASYVVSGIGFLGGGVILRDGMNVKGMNTAATLWCAAAVGVLSGSGFPLHAFIGTVTVLGLHLGLRPLSRRIDALRKASGDVETTYRVRVVCDGDREGLVRSILLRHVGSDPKMTLQSISVQDADAAGKAAITADIEAIEGVDRALQDLMSRLNVETGIASVRWEKVLSHSST